MKIDRDGIMNGHIPGNLPVLDGKTGPNGTCK